MGRISDERLDAAAMSGIGPAAVAGALMGFGPGRAQPYASMRCQITQGCSPRVAMRAV
jgi:hypothetical protein